MLRFALMALVLSVASPAHAELNKSQVRRAMKAHIRDFMACYEVRPAPPDHAAHVKFTIAPSGKVTEAVGSGNPAIHDCLANAVKKIEFPASDSETHVDYPFIIDFAGG